MYVGGGDFNDNVYALNASTGAKLWSYTIGGGGGTPVVANGMVYVGSLDNKLYAFGLPDDDRSKQTQQTIPPAQHAAFF